MLKEKITYTDYNNTTRTEEFYFNLSESDLIRLQAEADGESLEDMLRRVSESGSAKIVFNAFNKILSLAYGEKTPDGRRLVKGDDIWKAFTETPAYDVLILKMLRDPSYSANFINNLIPDSVIDNIKGTSENANSAPSITVVK